MIYNAVIELIGPAPVGYEPLAYVATVFITLFLLINAFVMIGGIIKKIGGM